MYGVFYLRGIMKLIKLTYYRSPNKYGGSGGKTEKSFFLNPSAIVTMVEYSESTKLTVVTGEKIEVCESKKDITDLINT